MPAPDWIQRWLRKAHGDIAIARLALRSGDQEPWIICFHAQQAAEKWLKAVIAAGGAEPSYTHSLVALEAGLPTDLQLPVTIEDLAWLTPYASTTRYVPSDVPEEIEPTMDDARAAVAKAESIGSVVSDWLAARGFDLLDKPEVDRGA